MEPPKGVCVAEFYTMGKMTKILTNGRMLMDNRGAALIITLLIITTLAGLTIAFSQQSSVDLSLAGYTRDGYRASLLAHSGLNLALALLDEDEDRSMDSLTEEWGLFGVASLPEKPSEEITFSGHIIDENSKININKLIDDKGEIVETRLEQLLRLFTVLGLGEAHVNAILDWLDSDDIKRMDGAEDYYYRNLERPYTCFNGPFMTTAQIFLVKGWKDIERFGEKNEKRLLNFLTVYGDQGLININTASREILMSLDEEIDTAMAQSIIEHRTEEDFTTTSDLSKVPGIDEELRKRISPWITVNSSFFTIELKVTCSEAMSHIRAVAERNDDQSSLTYYQVM
ncbi:MAG: type II secretion system minor pseudopilin GspK [Deltaproteobacteria bacterium]|nr:type II secretion system minor pseudopilin GspK [Deltaproteobacteria bacterium]